MGLDVSSTGCTRKATADWTRDVTCAYPELGELGDLLPGRVVLDGAIDALDTKGRPSFSALQQRMHVRAPSTALVRGTPVRFYLFDLLYLDGEDTTSRPYTERRAALQELAVSRQSLDTPPYWTGDAGRDLVTAAADLGLARSPTRLALPTRPSVTTLGQSTAQ
jgi:bifunctional non-homologous end joining protein LigD